MDLMRTLYLQDILRAIADALLVPVVVCLVVALLFTIYQLGTLVIEATTERRRYRAVVPEIIARIETASFQGMIDVVEECDLLRSQKDDLQELVTYLWLPEDGRTEVARRLLATENDKWMRGVRRCEAVSKVGPMLGLMGTLIPLGPGLMALGSGDTATLSSSLLIAFDTTTAGLAVALVCVLVSHLRTRWYRDYLVSMESLMNSILERGRILHEQGFAFPRDMYVYDEKGKTARKQPVEIPQDEGERKKPATEPQLEAQPLAAAPPSASVQQRFSAWSDASLVQQQPSTWQQPLAQQPLAQQPFAQQPHAQQPLAQQLPYDPQQPYLQQAASLQAVPLQQANPAQVPGASRPGFPPAGSAL